MAHGGGGIVLRGSLGNLRVFDTRSGPADVDAALAQAVFSGPDGTPFVGASSIGDEPVPSAGAPPTGGREFGGDAAVAGTSGREVFGLRSDSTNSLVMFSAFVQQSVAGDEVARTWVVAGMDSVKIVVDGAFTVAVVA
jgi:hypothetical protein